ncbi:MAG: zinc ribbon domain-containing protein [Candidatus Methanomethylophilaceae archaeon]|jgi:TM2 domain-containing membrane protein YozV|nr:zinc ribbon domain-containing protein [Candidatus Methanomethylophilaceae archaeon]NLF33803.1 zinc ribbon domain-containing protein [Thermoplasmatales archaeon]
MYCAKCGKELPAEGRYCPSCGADRYEEKKDQCGSAPLNLKDEATGLILSIIIPGTGHMYVGRADMGIMILLASVILVIAGFLVIFPWAIAFALWIWNVYDANKRLNAYNECVRSTGRPPY